MADERLKPDAARAGVAVMSGQIGSDVAETDWSRVVESNLREQVRLTEERARRAEVELGVETELHLAVEADARVQAGVAGALFEAALRHVEGERDRARAVAVRLEQELARVQSGRA